MTDPGALPDDVRFIDLWSIVRGEATVAGLSPDVAYRICRDLDDGQWATFDLHTRRITVVTRPRASTVPGPATHFVCPALRRERNRHNGPYSDHTVTLTGAVVRRPGKAPRWSRQYRCSCGQVGWSNHSELATRRYSAPCESCNGLGCAECSGAGTVPRHREGT